MTPIDRLRFALAAAECKPKRRGDDYYAKCPVHNGDDYDSLSFTEGADGRVLVTCHSQGCTYNQIMEALGLDVKDGFDGDDEPPAKAVKTLETTYDYIDEHGELLYQVLRYSLSTGGKTFSQQAADGKKTIKGIRRVLYNLPAVIEAVKQGELIVIVEGEKDVNRLANEGITATTICGGAIKKKAQWLEQYSSPLAGADIVIIPDNDEPGKTHAETVKDAINGTAKRVRIVELPGLPWKGDVSDWLDEHTADELLNAINNPPLNLHPVSIGDLLKIDFPPRRVLLDPWLREKDLTMVHAWRGTGKTWFSIGVARAVAAGDQFMKWKSPEPAGVLYIDGEMPGEAIKQRFAAEIISGEREPVAPLHIITPDLEPAGIRSLSTREGQQDIEDVLDSLPAVRLVILDNLSCLYGGVENDAEAWENMQGFILRIRRRGLAVLMVHHSGKGGEQRGTSRREDVLDVVIGLKRPGDYREEQGARFEVKFQKARGLHGSDVTGFEAQIFHLEEGKHVWTIKTIEQSTFEQVVNLMADGMTQAAIAGELGVNRSVVCRHVKRARREGRV